MASDEEGESSKEKDTGEEEKTADEVKKRGRKTNAERLGRERTASLGDINEMWRRKRERGVEEGGEEERLFRKSKLMQRSPEKKGGEESVETVIREMREVRDAIKEVAEQVQGIRKEMRKGEERWREEKAEMTERIRKLEGELEMEKRRGGKAEEWEERLERMERAERSGERERGRGQGGEELDRRVRDIERKLENRERDERRCNLVIKGIRPGKGAPSEEARGLLQQMEVGGTVEGVRVAGRWEEGREAVVIVRMSSVEEKKEVMRARHKLRGRGEVIEEDMTWEERRTQWQLRRVAEDQERKGRRTRVNHGKIWIEGEWWTWDEKREVIRDGRGRMMAERNKQDRERERRRSGEGQT